MSTMSDVQLAIIDAWMNKNNNFLIAFGIFDPLAHSS